MKGLKRTLSHPFVKWLLGIISAIVSFVTIDLSAHIERLFHIESIKVNSNSTEIYILIDSMTTVIDVLSKVVIGVLLLSVVIFSLSFINRHEATYSALEIVNYIKKHKIVINEITVFGYSLSFAQAIREHLYNTSNRQTIITIIVPDDDSIRTVLNDDTPSEARVQTLAGRIYEWERLATENRAASIEVIRTKDVPIEHGIMINNRLFFYFYYKWSYDVRENKFKFEKHDQKHRHFLLLKKHDSENEFDMLLRRLSIKIGLSVKNIS